MIHYTCNRCGIAVNVNAMVTVSAEGVYSTMEHDFDKPLHFHTKCWNDVLDLIPKEDKAE